MGNNNFKALEPNMEAVFHMPNVYRRLVKPSSVHESNTEKNVSNLLDQLVVHITSNAIRFGGLYAVGEKALETTIGVRNLDIVIEQKHKSDVVLINTLAYIAGRSVQLDYAKNKTLSEDVIEVETYLSCAIPAGQHTTETATFLENRFLQHTHLVIVYVGNKQVTVKITFKKAKVLKEGVPALYAILEGEKDMFTEFMSTYDLTDIDGKYFANKKIMHNDIGSGTIEYVYTVGVNPRPEQCTGERYGVGHAIQSAIQLMEDKRKGLSINRHQFSKIIENPEEYPKDRELAINCLAEARINQIEHIQNDIEIKYNTKMNGEPEVIAVYGGGSIEFKDDMYDLLKEFADEVNAKLLWIPSKYAVDLNAKGLDFLNRKVLFKEEYKELLSNEAVVD